VHRRGTVFGGGKHKVVRIESTWGDRSIRWAALEKLVEILGRIPLAITQASAYITRNRISVPKSLAALERDEQNPD
jgi:hypothetical protein